MDVTERRGQMEDHLLACDRLLKRLLVRHRAKNELHAPRFQGIGVDRIASADVEHGDLVAPIDEGAHEVNAGEPGAAGNESFHASLLLRRLLAAESLNLRPRRLTSFRAPRALPSRLETNRRRPARRRRSPPAAAPRESRLSSRRCELRL